MTDDPHSDIIMKVYDDIPVGDILVAIDHALENLGVKDYTQISREFGQYED